ncbi:histidinol dehydrogenase [Bradyrhizobium sp. LTSP885]|uniref:ABC transporter ATP-binding protein n=1 Tax=Bradyrhizobium sp. LTSP885 TaxID=1619232 RepID=UPI0005CAADBF|nr:ABC transporter ATP-binding protein [Bradyrhizobium sp. LTSP885]KJC50450.1 histidinol dehydrogenase [Bradyrhizobium sp. LTSP885]
MTDAALAKSSLAEPVLSVRGLNAWYGDSHVLQGMDFDVMAGEVVSILGRNGVGKTTTLRAIMGILPKRSGSVSVFDQETIKMAPRSVARLGVGYCPEERGIFASLTVKENLMLPPVVGKHAVHLDEIFEMFPNLKERLASPGTKLSGGEQQMLAIARILRSGSRLLLLDEPTEGLAPVIVQQIGATIRRLKERGFTIILVEQGLHFVRSIADRHYLVEHGQIARSVDNKGLLENMDSIRGLLAL